MKKIELNNDLIPCPACLEKNARGNSYPLMFLKSWECSNPKCPERSKSGRGKRFDEYGALRYFKLVEHNSSNIISDNIFAKWRKDFYKKNQSLYDVLLLYYSWNNEKVLIIDKFNINRDYERKLIYSTLESFLDGYNKSVSLQSTKIYTTLKKIAKLIIPGTHDIDEISNSKLYNDNSSLLLSKFPKNSIGCCMTSPPYYNAREYSQWPDFLTYLVDMMINAKRVFDVLHDNGTYIYNVGDIVGQENIFVNSHMSNRRLMLGFYSVLAFKVVGYEFMGDIIWNKGEVQSKRNSTPNHFSGYLKFVNCYEHNLLFRKKVWSDNNDIKTVSITPVIKINSKGENIYGHTAPYPVDLVEIMKPYVKDKSLPILDPFLGSGTTALWCKINGLKYIGIEMDSKYFDLSINRLKNNL